MKKYLLLLILSFIISCKKDLTGHWHLRDLENNSYSKASIEILENNDCYLYFSLSSKPSKGEHFPQKNVIAIPSDCGVFMFDYKINNDKLYLTNDLGTEFIAEKQNDNCDRFKDFKTLLNINFLKIENQKDLFKPKDSIENEGLSYYFNIDYDTLNNKIRIEHFNEINSVDKIKSIIEYIENSVSEVEIPFINYVLTPDKNLKASNLKLVINKLNEGYKKKIYIQTLKIKPEKMNIFEYIKINNLDLESDNKLLYIIN